MKKFSEEHEWVELENGLATVGISAYAAEELGDITFVELPDTGLVVTQGETLCVIESVKAASDIFSPVGGTVSAVNEKLEENPGMINESAEKDAWICKLDDVAAADLESLMSEEEYEEFVPNGGDE